MTTRKRKIEEVEMVDPIEDASVIEETVEVHNTESTVVRFVVAPDYRFGYIQCAGIGFSKYQPVEISKGSPHLPEILKNPFLVQYD